jgi:hypothetical protein
MRVVDRGARARFVPAMRKQTLRGGDGLVDLAIYRPRRVAPGARVSAALRSHCGATAPLTRAQG